MAEVRVLVTIELTDGRVLTYHATHFQLRALPDGSYMELSYRGAAPADSAMPPLGAIPLDEVVRVSFERQPGAPPGG